jgi:soluble lytic murein transglycosylase-like protein
MTKYRELINAAALKYKLDPRLVAAIILQESSGRPDVSRWEPGFYKRYIEGRELDGFVPDKENDTKERQNRATSWGLMQIMGQVAREFGYWGRDLAAGLCDPATNINLGCKIFARYLAKNNGDIVKALLRYNGGGNPNYPKEVLAKMRSNKIGTIL